MVSAAGPGRTLLSKMTQEMKRGLSEGRQHFQALHARWPRAFPVKSHELRPLASGAVPIVAAEMGWTKAFARGVLKNWKSREPYCRAVLAHAARITLDGSESGEIVADEARALASERLAWCAARRQRERKAEQRATAPPLADPPPAEVLPSAPPQQEPGKRAGIEALRAAHLARLAAA
jgi:sRNA-binding protein